MPAPIAVTRWLQSAYPTLRISSDWLDACCDFLATKFADLSPQQLIKKVEQQILLSSLADSCSSGALPTRDLSETLSERIAAGPRAAILVQVNAITEVGHSAFSLKEVHDQRKEERKIEARGGQLHRVVGNVDQEEEEQKGPPKFPRAMLMMELSDGFTVMRAMEYKRIPALSLEETQLGCKVRNSHRSSLSFLKSFLGLDLAERREGFEGYTTFGAVYEYDFGSCLLSDDVYSQRNDQGTAG